MTTDDGKFERLKGPLRRWRWQRREEVTAGLLAITLQDMDINARSWQGWQPPRNPLMGLIDTDILSEQRRRKGNRSLLVGGESRKVTARSITRSVRNSRSKRPARRLASLGDGLEAHHAANNTFCLIDRNLV